MVPFPVTVSVPSLTMGRPTKSEATAMRLPLIVQGERFARGDCGDIAGCHVCDVSGQRYALAVRRIVKRILKRGVIDASNLGDRVFF